MISSLQKLRRGVWGGLLSGVMVLFFCSLPENLVRGEPVDPEKQELMIAIDILRKENAELHRLDAAHKRELADATKRLTSIKQDQRDGRAGLVADDDETWSKGEWKVLLQNALKVLHEADREIDSLRKRLQMLVYASKETFKTAERVDPIKRSLLEAEIRQSERLFLSHEKVGSQVIIPVPEISASSSVKIVGVQLDFGVAALAVGRKSGARVGMPFLVLREKNVVAVLTLAEVRETVSLALIEQMNPEKPIKVGDIAVLRRT